MSAYRDRIYRELHDYICATYPPDEIANRFGALLNLLQHLQSLSKELEETITLCNIFSPHHVELWQ